MRDFMPTKNASETIEILSRNLERVQILNDLKSCTNFEELQEYIKELKLLIEKGKRE